MLFTSILVTVFKILCQFDVLLILELVKIALRSCEDCKELFCSCGFLGERLQSCLSSVRRTGQCQCLLISENGFLQLSLEVAHQPASLRCWMLCSCISASAS